MAQSIAATVTPWSMKKYLPRPTKAALRQALHDHHAKVEFFVHGGGPVFTIREAFALGFDSIEVRKGADFWAIIEVRSATEAVVR